MKVGIQRKCHSKKTRETERARQRESERERKREHERERERENVSGKTSYFSTAERFCDLHL